MAVALRLVDRTFTLSKTSKSLVEKSFALTSGAATRSWASAVMAASSGTPVVRKNAMTRKTTTKAKKPQNAMLATLCCKTNSTAPASAPRSAPFSPPFLPGTISVTSGVVGIAGRSSVLSCALFSLSIS